MTPAAEMQDCLARARQPDAPFFIRAAADHLERNIVMLGELRSAGAPIEALVKAQNTITLCRVLLARAIVKLVKAKSPGEIHRGYNADQEPPVHLGPDCTP